MKNITAFIISIAIGLIAWALLRSQIQKEQDEFYGDSVVVVVAERYIEAGTTLTRAHLEPLNIPRKWLAPQIILASDVDRILGRTIIRSVKQGHQISWDDIEKRALDLSGDIKKSHRAFTLITTDHSTQAGQLTAGDRVDVVAVFTNSGEFSSRTILQNILVLAVGGKRFHPLEDELFSQVTLELTPEQCQHLALARETAEITLSLRPKDDHELINAQPTEHSELGRTRFKLE